MLEPLGLEVDSAQCRTSSELIGFLAGADYVITQFAPVNAEVISSLSAAKVIVRYGIGVDNVDLAKAREMGIPVCNVPDFCLDEVADHTLALILAATRQVVANGQHVRNGKWGLPVPLAEMRCLRTMTVGVVGFGRIGREVTARLRPFGCRILVFDPIAAVADVEAAGGEAVSLNDLLQASDLVTLHCPSNDATRQLIDDDAVRRMKDRSILVNVARGAVVSTESLIAGLQSGKLAFAAVDVLETEPMPAHSPLRTMDNVIVHSHIASASESAVTKLRRDAASLVACAAKGKPLRNVVNGVTITRELAKSR